MKRLTIYLVLITVFHISCEKQTSDEFSSAKSTIEIVDVQFQDDLIMSLDILEENQILEVTTAEETVDYRIFTSTTQSNIASPRKVRCRGNGLSFIKCVKKAVEEHGCQQITMQGDDYVSNDCP